MRFYVPIAIEAGNSVSNLVNCVVEPYEKHKSLLMEVIDRRLEKRGYVTFDGYNKTQAIFDKFVGVLYELERGETQADVSIGSTVKYSILTRPKSPYKTFAKRQAAGEMVVNPLEKGRVIATENPGFYPGSPVGSPMRKSGNAYRNALSVTPFLECRKWPQAYFYNAAPEFVFYTGVYNPGVPPFSHTVRRQRYDGGGFIPNPENIKNDLYSNVLKDLRSFQINKGLVTDVRAEAASGEWDILTELGEMPETVKMILSACKVILLKYREMKGKEKILRKNHIGSNEDLLTQLSSLWMQYRYAIQPIAYSIQDGLNYLNRQSVAYQSFRQGLTEDYGEVRDLHGFVCIKKPTVTHRCFIKHQLDLSAATTGLSANLFSTAWELLPLSWFWDWALNIGTLLSSFGTPRGSIAEVGTYSFRVKGELVYENPTTKGLVVFDIDYYRTAPIATIDHVGLNVDLFLDWKRSLDAAALGWSIFLKPIFGKKR